VQSAAWTELLRLIPPALRENLALVTSNGAEIALQSIIRAERDYLVIKGRLTGTTEGHGVFIIPFDRLSHVTFQKSVTEAEVKALFEAAPTSNALATSNETQGATPTSRSAPAELTPVEHDKHAESSNRPLGLEPRPAAVDKAALLERLRSRRPVSGPVRPTGT
jgi:hypothetical protein